MTNQPRILVVDDEPQLTRVLRTGLKSRGYDVRAAADGLAGFEAFNDWHPDLVITDLAMPNVDGLELCRRIRATERPYYPYVILLTALKGKDHFLQAMSAGIDDFISKPFDVDELRAKLHVAERIVTLQDRVKRLEGILPTCMYCKKIRDENQTWVSIEQYVTKRSDAEFSHGICPDCFTKASAQLGEIDQ